MADVNCKTVKSPAGAGLYHSKALSYSRVSPCMPYFFASQSSVLNGAAGNPSVLNNSPSGQSLKA